MVDDKLPAAPADDGKRLFARRAGDQGRRAAPMRGHPLSIDVLGEDRREDEDEIDLRAYWRILVKRRGLVLGVLAGVVALALLVTLMTRPTYRATAVLQIDAEEQQVIQVGGTTPVASSWDPEFLQTQYALLKSRSLAERVADALNLDHAALQGLALPGGLERLVGMLRPSARTPAQPARQPDAAAELSEATSVVQTGLSIEPVRDSRLVQLHFDSPVPAFSARVANAVAEGFIAAGVERRYGASAYAKTYLEDQLSQVKSRLEDSERQLVVFAQKVSIVSTDEGQSLVGQNLSDLNSALATAQEQRIRAQARWRQAQAARGAALPADMLGNSILRTLQQQHADLQGQYQQKLQIYKPDYPLMQQLKGQMDELDQRISGELVNIRASVKAEYDAAASQERLLMEQLGSLRSQTLDVDSRSIEYNILKREVDTNRQLYDSLLKRYMEVGVAGDVRTNNITIIDRAQVPGGAFSPNITKNLALGLLLGLLLGGVLAFLLEFFDDTLKTPEDIEEHLHLPVLGIIPKLVKQSPLEALEDARSAFAESYRSVRTALQFSTDQGVPRVLLITSPGATEGKSTAALTLARKFAKLGRRVLLIEADMRNPSLHKVLGLRSGVGLSSLLAGAATPADAILDTDNEHLKVILAGPLPPNPAELLAGSKLVSLLTLAGEKFDQVIIDGPPILGIADAPILANIASGTLLMIQSDKTKIVMAQAAVKRLHAVRAHLVGALLSHYGTRTAGYSYYAYGTTPRLTSE